MKCRYGIEDCKDCTHYMELEYINENGDTVNEKKCVDEWIVVLLNRLLVDHKKGVNSALSGMAMILKASGIHPEIYRGK